MLGVRLDCYTYILNASCESAVKPQNIMYSTSKYYVLKILFCQKISTCWAVQIQDLDLQSL